ncbi:RrF2 family transcriptional regulator [Natronogracilivirga saccharolytica]|uniref:Rrf2 family transcriptional regulator n=1 Tax=Natronogracilivirga saccharolytica TaxID=2812953 RepID=A0A8J7S4G6_9BACT|nr:Rrf2 family transcriptional regulator [Natronogracilivirga saccharolytica]MBP3191803.1 Rrf2 family transcriptional regulator [Natronogracilivirga saccharolytica]
MVLSKACTYGILASLFIARETARSTAYVPIGKMSKELHISFHFLTKILQELTSAGLLVSMKGPRGGVAFKRDPDEITILDVVLAIDGIKVFRECLLGLPGCGNEEPCPVHDEWAEIRENLYNTFHSKTLSDTARRIDELNLRFALPELYDQK